MSTFAEVRFETGYIIYQTDGGPLFSTTIVTMNSGYEQRNQVWSTARAKWDFGDRKLPDNELTEIIKFFRARKGMAEGFRFKDWSDYQVASSEGTFCAPGTAVFAQNGNGYPTLQLAKQYNSGVDYDYRWIRKPVSGTVAPTRNNTVVTFGAAVGNVSLDTTTGLLTFVADATSGATSITVGATTTVVLTTNPNSLAAGKLLYLSGFAGTDSGLVNNIAHTINSVTGTGPYTFVLNTNTSGKVITLGGGIGYAYPQISDSISWSGQFDVAVRFDTDELKSRFDSADVTSPGVLGKTYHYLHPLPLVEIRV